MHTSSCRGRTSFQLTPHHSRPSQRFMSSRSTTPRLLTSSARRAACAVPCRRSAGPWMCMDVIPAPSRYPSATAQPSRAARRSLREDGRCALAAHSNESLSAARRGCLATWRRERAACARRMRCGHVHGAGAPRRRRGHMARCHGVVAWECGGMVESGNGDACIVLIWSGLFTPYQGVGTSSGHANSCCTWVLTSHVLRRRSIPRHTSRTDVLNASNAWQRRRCTSVHGRAHVHTRCMPVATVAAALSCVD